MNNKLSIGSNVMKFHLQEVKHITNNILSLNKTNISLSLISLRVLRTLLTKFCALLWSTFLLISDQTFQFFLKLLGFLGRPLYAYLYKYQNLRNTCRIKPFNNHIII